MNGNINPQTLQWTADVGPFQTGQQVRVSGPARAILRKFFNGAKKDPALKAKCVHIQSNGEPIPSHKLSTDELIRDSINVGVDVEAVVVANPPKKRGHSKGRFGRGQGNSSQINSGQQPAPSSPAPSADTDEEEAPSLGDLLDEHQPVEEPPVVNPHRVKDEHGFLQGFKVKAQDVIDGLVVSAQKLFGLKRKALDGIPVRVIGSDHPMVPAVDPNFYADYQKGETLATALRRLWMTEEIDSLPTDLILREADPEQANPLTPSEKATLASGRKRNKRSNCWFHGHAGTGKSSLVEHIAGVTGRPFFTLPCHAGTTMNHFFGDTDVRAVGQGEQAQDWKDGLFAKGVATPHAVVLIDEIARADDTHLISLNAPLENRQVLIPEAGISEPFAKGVWVCAADNGNATECEHGIYAGAELDASIPSRFRTGIKLDFLPSDVEAKVLCDMTGIDAPTASEIVKVANALRTATTSGQASKLLPSLRDLEAWAEAIMLGEDPVQAFGASVVALGVDADDHQTAKVICQDQFGAEALNLVGYSS